MASGGGRKFRRRDVFLEQASKFLSIPSTKSLTRSVSGSSDISTTGSLNHQASRPSSTSEIRSDQTKPTSGPARGQGSEIKGHDKNVEAGGGQAADVNSHGPTPTVTGRHEIDIPLETHDKPIWDEDIDIVVVAYLGVHPPQRKKLRVAWNEKTVFEKLSAIAVGLLSPHHVPKGWRLYVKYGSAHAISTSTESDFGVCPLDTEDDWTGKVRLMVAEELIRLKKIHPSETLTLEARWTYGILPELRPKADDLRKTIRKVLSDGMTETYEPGKDYVPHRVLQTIFDEEIVEALVCSDISLRDTIFQGPEQVWRNKSEFAKDVYVNGVPLLALFIYVGKELVLLHDILSISKQDSYRTTPLLNRFLTDQDRPKECEDADFKLLRQNQYSFKAHRFSDAQATQPTRIDLEPNVIVPIAHVPKSGDEAALGEGNYGRVFRVRVEPGHHRFDADQSKLYALKVFKKDVESSEEGLINEARVLRKLVSRGQNLILYRAIWTHNSRLYMLFDLAEGSLKERLSKPRTAIRNWSEENGFALTLIRLLRGIAQGVRHIHRSARLQETHDTRGSDYLAEPEQNRAWTGYHHDLKPANILYLQDDQGQEVWKISDFGTARLSKVAGSGTGDRSIGTTSDRGDQVYKSPDYRMKASSSRPSDIWSLGCIFLEVLLWAFHLAKLDPKVEGSFEQKRLINSGVSPERTETPHIPRFWYQYEDNQGREVIELRPVVKGHLDRLKEHCKWTVFSDLVHIAHRMLNIRTENRPEASEVVEHLTNLLIQAGAEIEDDKDLTKPFSMLPREQRVTSLPGGSVAGEHIYDHGPVEVLKSTRRAAISSAQLQLSRPSMLDTADLDRLGEHHAPLAPNGPQVSTPALTRRTYNPNDARFSATVTAPGGSRSPTADVDGNLDERPFYAEYGSAARDEEQSKVRVEAIEVASRMFPSQ